MASKVHTLKLGPFGSLNTRKEAWLLEPSEAQVAQDNDAFTGALAGTLALGSSVRVSATYPNARWIWPLGGGDWAWADERRWAMNDGGKTYFTRSGQKPQTADAAGNTYDLGIRPPSGASWSLTYLGGTGNILAGTYKYGISYITFDGLESNIQNFDLTFTWPISGQKQIAFTDVWPSDARVSKVQLWRTTAANNGIFYRMPTAGVSVGSVTSRAGTVLIDYGDTIDADLDDDTTGGLTWTYGGFPNNNATLALVYGAIAARYTSDHAPAPVLTRLADRIHSIAAGTAIAGSGIVFGAVGNILRWSVNGNALYWPIVNSMPFDHTIEAIVAYSGYVVVFTTGGVYRVSGNNDDAMENERLPAFYTVKAGAGKSCLRTPHGTIYLATEGLAVFNGSSSEIISTPKIDPDDFDLTIYDAAYFGSKYYLFHSAGYMRMDLRDGWKAVRFNTSATVINCVTVADFKNPLVGDAQRAIPVTASSATEIGLRRFGFCSDGAGKLYLAGGTRINLTTGAGETSVGTAYVLDTSSASAVWVALSTLDSAQIRSNWQLVHVNGFLYGFGGINALAATVGASTYYGTTQVFNIGTAAWSIDSTGSGPGGIAYYAAAADTTGADTSGYWVHGGMGAAATVLTNLFKYTISGPSWATTSSGGPTLQGHGMVYVPGSVFSDGHPRLFIFGGSTDTSFTAPTNIVYCFDLTDNTWTNDSISDLSGTVSSALAAGCAKRSRHAWVYDSVSKKIFLHGGKGLDGAELADIWEFGPRGWVDAGSGARVPSWVNSSGAVVNVEDRFWHGAAFVGTTDPQTLYLAGGSSMLELFNSDLYAVRVQALTGPNSPGYSTTPGVYALKPADGGNIYRMEAGAAQQAIWQTGDFLGESPAAIKYAGLGQFDYQGDVALGVYIDGGSVQTMVTLSSASRTQVEQMLPWTGATAPRGTRLSFRLLCKTAAAATSGVAGKVFSGQIKIDEEIGG